MLRLIPGIAIPGMCLQIRLNSHAMLANICGHVYM